MKVKNKIASQELFSAVYISLMVEFILRPFAQAARYPAQITIMSAIINTAIIILFFGIIMNKNIYVKFNSLTAEKISKFGDFIAFVLISAATGESFAVLWSFLQQISDKGPHLIVFILLTLLVTAHAAHKGPYSVTRSAEIIFIMLLTSLLIVLLANIQNMRLENIVFSDNYSKDVFEATFKGFYFSPALIVWLVLSKNIQGDKKVKPTTVLIFVAIGYIILSVLSELVLGEFAAGENQPVYTLARVGSLSVFKRLDSFHSFIWMVVMLGKIALYLYAAKLALSKSVSGLSNNKSIIIIAGLAVVFGFIFIFLATPAIKIWFTVFGILTAVLITVKGGD